MSVVSSYIEAQAAFNARLSQAIDGLTEDVASLRAQIESALADAVSADEKARLSDLLSASEAVVSRAEALDALTPPNPPASNPNEAPING